MNIKVSVIIPIYNVESYIEECLVSVLKQSLQDIEIICVNDGTKDNSMEIVNQYAEKDKRIVVVEKENGGLSSARNAGLSKALGEYVYFLDSDDYIAENMLEVLYREVVKDNLDNIYFDAESFFETQELEITQKRFKDFYRRPDMFQEVVSGQQLFAKMDYAKAYRSSACLQMPKREMLEKNGIHFYEGIVHEDNLFSLQVIMSAQKAKHIAVPFYKRRIREGSIMTGEKEFRSSYGYFICILEFKKFLQQYVITDPAVMKAVNHRFLVMQNLAVNELKTMTIEEIEFELAKYPLNLQIEYSMMVKRVFEEKLSSRKKQEENTKLYKKKISKLEHSTAYCVGEMITKVPRKGYHFVRNVWQKGIVCTAYGVKRKLTKEQMDLSPAHTCVSVIIPMYNAEKYLRECLDRLLRQTLKSIEIICVNDGSTDQTMDILKEYVAKDARIRIVNQENQGAGIARNHGMEAASGEYYLFLDADDIFDERLCELAYYKAKYDMADIVLFEAYRLNMQTMKKQEMNWVLRENMLPDKIPFSMKDIKGKIYQLTTACPWSKMFRAKFVKKHGLQFQNTKNANDVFFVRTALVLAKRITVLKKRLVTYRFQDGANTQSRKNKAPVEFYKAFKALKEELKQRGIYEKVERSYVNMVLSESLFNLHTAGSKEAEAIVKKLLVDEGFDFFELNKYNRDYFYQEKEYEEYCKLMKKI